jgi:hypothetical protein
MVDPRRRLGRTVWFSLFSATACLTAGTAGAQQCFPDGVTCYIRAQAIDECSSAGTLCAPFNNTNGLTGNPATQNQCPVVEGQPPANPIGFFDPNTGEDITRALLNQGNVDLVYTSLPSDPTGCKNIFQYNAQPKPGTTTTYQTLNVTQGATCTGYITTGTLTITSCSSGVPSVSDILSGTGIKTGTVINGVVGNVTIGTTGTNSTRAYTVNGAYTVSPSQTVGSSSKQITITATSSKYQSLDSLVLMGQPGISQGVTPQGFPNAPLGVPSTVYNVVFATKLNPPASQVGQLNGFTYLGQNGTAIGANTFFPPAGVPLPIDVLAHEFDHGVGGLPHTANGAGPWTAPAYVAPAGVVPTTCTGSIGGSTAGTAGTTLTIDFPGCSSGSLYVSAPLSGQGITPGTVITAFGPNTSGGFGTYTVNISQSVPDGTTITVPVPAHPLVGECDGSYPGCLANLMTIGALRTESTLACLLAPSGSAACSGVPTLANGGAGQLTLETQENPNFLPLSQQTQMLPSGLLWVPTNVTFLHPIPFETTKAQAGTGGNSDRAIFDLSHPVGGRPGETLVAWVLTLPQGQTFARPGQFDILAQSRKDLVQSVDYYPDAENNPLKRTIAYQLGADDNADNPGIGAAAPSPCAFATAECMVVKFEPPGLGAHDSITFSKGILSGGAPIASDDLCKAKITYMFSDGYATTGNFGPCPPRSFPLISSSWRPDLRVPPRMVTTNLLLVDAPQGGPACLPDPDNTSQCKFNQFVTGLEDGNPAELLQPGQSCGGTGTINHNVTVAANQNCVFRSPCEIQGNVTINGGTFWSDCMVDGNINNNGGRLVLAPSASVAGVVQISGGSGFAISGATLSNNLGIQNLPAGILQPSTVCGTKVNGNLSVQNNASPIEIGGGSVDASCSGNTITNRLQCQNNTGLIVQGNRNPAGQPIQCN